MSRRLDYGHDFRKRQARHGLGLKDEAEWVKKGHEADIRRCHGPIACGAYDPNHSEQE
jgi:hypothetical protein